MHIRNHIIFITWVSSFKVTKVHQTSVNTYLEDVILKTMNNVADEQSRKEIRKMADKINNVSHEIERKSVLIMIDTINVNQFIPYTLIIFFNHFNSTVVEPNWNPRKLYRN